jgi:hypothetical protein
MGLSGERVLVLSAAGSRLSMTSADAAVVLRRDLLVAARP